MFTGNPIYQRELRVQRRATPRPIQILDSVGIVSMALILIVVLLWLMWTNLLVPTLNQYDDQLVLWAQVISWAVHLLAIGRAILAGLEAGGRDGSPERWEELKLATVSPLRLIVGKWWAALYRSKGWLAALGLIQLGVVGILFADVALRTHTGQLIGCLGYASSGQVQLFANVFSGCLRFTDQFWLAWQQVSGYAIPIAVAVAVILSILEIAASTALGTACAIVLRGPMRAMLLAFALRDLPIIFFAFWHMGPDIPPTTGGWTWRWMHYVTFSLADGGTSSLLRISVMPGHYLYPHSSIAEAFGLGTGLLLLFWGGSLFVGWLTLRLNGFTRAQGRYRRPAGEL